MPYILAFYFIAQMRARSFDDYESAGICTVTILYHPNTDCNASIARRTAWVSVMFCSLHLGFLLPVTFVINGGRKNPILGKSGMDLGGAEAVETSDKYHSGCWGTRHSGSKTHLSLGLQAQSHHHSKWPNLMAKSINFQRTTAYCLQSKVVAQFVYTISWGCRD